MKQAKKLAAVLLSLVMLLALVIPASAQIGEYSITINDTNSNHTYTAYQIFKGDISESDTEPGPYVLSNIKWGNGVKTDGLIDALRGVGDFAGLAEDATAADVAELLTNAKALDAFLNVINRTPGFLAGAGTPATPETGEDSCTIKLNEAGYYLIKDSLDEGTVGESVSDYIVQVLGQESVQPKESPIPNVEKKVQEDDKHTADDGYGAGYNDVADWDIGDSVPFKLIGSIPDMSAYDTYKYVFHDTLSAGLTLEAGSVNVYVVGTKNADLEVQTPLTSTTYSLATTGLDNGESFTITFNNLKTVKGAGEGKFIIVTYTATLNDSAEIGLPGNPNEVYLEFSNDPNGDGTGKTTTDKVIVFTYELDGTKVDGEAITTTLPGAQFVLLNADGDKVA
jgi:fimbrial isopeptide formation D2 family protein